MRGRGSTANIIVTQEPTKIDLIEKFLDIRYIFEIGIGIYLY